MKKILSILSIVVIVGFATTPAFAAPHHGGGHGYGHGRPVHSQIHHGNRHHRPAPVIHNHYHNSGYISAAGLFARPGYWRNYYGCNCRLGLHNHYHHCPYYRNTGYVNVGIPIRF